MAKYVGKRIVPKLCGAWNDHTKYEMLSVVLDENTGDSYVARKEVPAGTGLNQTEYWALSSRYSQQIQNYSNQLTETLRQVKADNDETEAIIRQSNAATAQAIANDNDETESTIRQNNAATRDHVDEALGVMNQAKQSFDSASAALTTRMDSIVGGATTDTEEGRLTSTGNTRWDESRIYTIIMNEKYAGDILMQKKYTENHITHKEVKNRNRMVPQYYIRDHHQPIITRKQYERCQRIAVLKSNHGKPIQYPYGDMLICPVCGHRLRQHEVKGHKGMSGWHCDRDEDSCRRYIARTKQLDRAILEAVNGLDAAKLKAEGYTELAAFRRKHWKVKTVDYYWLDEYVEKLVFGRGHTLTVHWKCGLQTTVKMRVTCNTYDPVKLAEMTMAEGS